MCERDGGHEIRGGEKPHGERVRHTQERDTRQHDERNDNKIKGREATLCRFLFMAINRKLKILKIKEKKQEKIFFHFVIFRVGAHFYVLFKIKILQV